MSIKKWLLSVLFATCLLVSFSSVSFALSPYTNGLLKGKSMTVQSTSGSGTTSQTLNLTDSDMSTSIVVDDYKSAFYSFNPAVTVDQIYFAAAYGDLYYTLTYEDNSTQTLSQRGIGSRTEYTAPISTTKKIKKVAFYGGSGGVIVYEVDLRGARETTPPGEVTNLVATPISTTSVKLSWTNPTDADFSKVDIYKDSSFVNSVSSPETTYTVTGLSPSTNYTFILKTVDSSLNYSAGNSVTVTTPAPPVPTNVSIRTGSVTHQSVQLLFGATSADSIKVYRDAQLIATVSGTSTSYTDTGRNASTKYSYYIVATNVHGSTASSIIDVTTADPPPPPSGVYIQSKNVTYREVELTIGAIDADIIKLYRDGELLTQLSGSAESYTDTTIQPNKIYKYHTVASNSYGYTASSIIEVSTPQPTPPSNVQIQLQTVEDTSAAFSFGAKDADTIKLYRDGAAIKTFLGGATTYTDSNLTSGKTYQYWIVAENAYGKTASPIISVQTKKPAQIRNLRTIEKKREYLKFTWDVEPTAEKYRVVITVTHNQTASVSMAAGEPPKTTSTIDTTANEITVNNLNAGDTVDLSVSIVNSKYGVHGTATTREVAPAADIPNLQVSNNIASASDLFQSSVSLASNFWPFLLVGLAFFLAPFIYRVITKSVTVGKQEGETKKERDIKRDIRIALREDK